MPTIADSKRIKNPFPGLRPFETDEYRLFFGREGQSDELIKRLERTHFLAIVGTSGSGKSSLVRAGLLPALRGGLMAGAGSGWRISIMRPGSDPIGNLAAALADKDVLLEAGGALAAAEAGAVIEATLRRGSLGLVEAAKRARLGEHEKLLIVVDQFEELFRFRAARTLSSTGDDAAAFVKLLIEASQQRELQIYVVPTMRSDFLGDCAQFQGLPEAINEGQYLIPRMTRDERRVAISGPVGVTRGKITEPLVNRLMNDVGDNPDQLPIMQHALMRTWNYWAQHRRNGEPIGLEHYDAVGTMANALSLHADEAFNELTDERSRTIAERLFKALTERGADNREIRRPTSLKDICGIAGASAAEVIAVVDVFRGGGRSFLMPPAGVPLYEDTVIDISHESLIRNWRRLKDWVNEEAQSARIYRRLAEAAVLHSEGGEGLLQDPGLQIGLDWRAQSKPTGPWARRYHPEFEKSLRYLDDSSAARAASVAERERQQQEQIARERRELEQAQLYAEQQRRAARRLRWLATGMAVMFVLSILTAGYAVAAKRKADAALIETDRQRKEIAETLRGKLAAEEARAASDEQRKLAELARMNATQAQKVAFQKALIEEERAKQEAKRANEEAEKAKRFAMSAQLAIKEANIQKGVAQENEAHAQNAVERGELIRSGLEAYRRGNVPDAQQSFIALRDKLLPLQPGTPESTARSFAPKDSMQFVNDYGWTLSHLADTYQSSRDYESAIETYEQARQILEGQPKSEKRAILFETYHGLAHAYHDNAVMLSDPSHTQLTAPRLKLNPEEQFKKAEEYYTRALNYLKDTGSKDPVATVVAYQNLARLYVDTAKFKEAEDNLKLVVDAYKTVEYRPGPRTIGALKELAEFYRGQGRHTEAAETYNELIDLQEGLSDDDGGGLGALADNYGELGQIYAALNEDERAETVFQLSEKLQQVQLQVKHRGNAVIKPDAADITYDIEMDQIGDLYARLNLIPQALRSYQEALMIRREVTVKHNLLPATYLKLAGVYDEHYPDKSKAEGYYKLVIDATNSAGTNYLGDEGLRERVQALRGLASLYAGDLGQPAQAEALLNSALAALVAVQSRLAWRDELGTYAALLALYQGANKDKERDHVYARLFETISKRHGDFISGSYRSEDYPQFMSAYFKTAGEIATFYLQRKDVARAAAVYADTVSGPPFINRVYDPKALDEMASSLEKWRNLLRGLQKTEDAIKLDRIVSDSRARQEELLATEKEIEQSRKKRESEQPAAAPSPNP
jgi:energy-coupling factor transporter ATP-binding protein EcfA2